MEVSAGKMTKKKTDETTINTLQKRIEELEHQLKRALADYQNLEKRVQQEKGEWIRSANKDLILRLLPALDTLLLAGKHVSDQGLALSIQEFLDVLKEEGVARIETEGKDFDPLLMECVETQEGQEGKVYSEVRVGYTLHGRAVRPAQVKVGKGENHE